MNTADSKQSDSGPGTRVNPPPEAPEKERIRDPEAYIAFFGLVLVILLVGVGFGWYVHPGVGIGASGLVFWSELLMWSKPWRDKR